MNTLKIDKLTKTYANGVKAMQNISLEIGNGIFGLLGPNGAGKSTLMRTIAGLQQPDSGQIIFNGADVVAEPVLIKQHLGYLPQDFGVYPKVSAYDLLEHLAVLKGITSAKERKEQILALLEKTNLYAHRNKAVSSYSGGMRQRFGVAQALLGNPHIIIVDEPTAGLDPEERNRFNNLLSEIGEQVIIILSTHLVEDVHNLCTQMAIINKGSLLAYGEPDTFINQLEGRIWSQTIDRADLPTFREQYQVISVQLHAGRQSIHVYAENEPGNGFALRQPDLEDVYFAQLYHTK
ncbi:ABC transporter ATP-binding protein [Mucilaginibacter gynuensis]|uniref:ABC transporter ATP-binding protein n=1 Tax=Mucilaginibacter gynuensis TaxID=1302236 RepID=A0ABP8FX36_9SPHI